MPSPHPRITLARIFRPVLALMDNLLKAQDIGSRQSMIIPLRGNAGLPVSVSLTRAARVRDAWRGCWHRSRKRGRGCTCVTRRIGRRRSRRPDIFGRPLYWPWTRVKEVAPAGNISSTHAANRARRPRLCDGIFARLQPSQALTA